MASTGEPDGLEGAFPGGLTRDAFLGGRLILAQPRRGFRAGQDAVLLAAAVPARPGDAALDLGCGGGAAILALGARVPGLALAGLEVQPAYAALARANAAQAGLILDVLEGDVAVPPADLGVLAFDHVLMNPPFHSRASSTPAHDPGRDLAHGGDAPLAAWLGLAARRLRPRGSLTAIQRVARLPELLAGLPATMGSVEVMALAPRSEREPTTILLRARKGGRAPFRLLPPLAVHESDGAFSPAIREALRDGAALPWG